MVNALSTSIYVINFFHENFLYYFVTALYISTIQNPKNIKNGRGYLIIHPARTTRKKFQYGLFFLPLVRCILLCCGSTLTRCFSFVSITKCWILFWFLRCHCTPGIFFIYRYLEVDLSPL